MGIDLGKQLDCLDHEHDLYAGAFQKLRIPADMMQEMKDRPVHHRFIKEIQAVWTRPYNPADPFQDLLEREIIEQKLEEIGALEDMHEP